MLNVLTKEQTEEVVAKSVGTPTELKRMQVWLDERIARGKKENGYAEKVTLTPALAHLLLRDDFNVSNRKISQANIETIRADVLAGRWLYNGESLSISKTGKLLDGQHRCDVVVQTGISIPVTISFGAPDEARFTIDIGKPKSAANFLHMKGYSDCNNLAATIALVLEYQKNGTLTLSRKQVSKTDVVTNADELRGIQASVSISGGATKRGLGSRSTIAFCHYILKKRAGVVAADEFIAKLIDGDGLRKDDPIYHCRNRLLDLRGTTQAAIRAGIVFRAWNHWRNGEKISKLVAPKQLPKVER
jgi:hypothetical protein